MPDAGRFRVDVLAWDEIHAIVGDWGPSVLRQLLDLAEVGPTAQIADGDLLELVLMALEDLELRAACDLTLRVVFGDRLAPGVRQNLIEDLQDDRPWEQFADPAHQRGIFTSVVLLQLAYPTMFGKPDAARVRLGVEALDDRARALLRRPPHPSLVVRLLGGGMPATAVLRRLYGEALAGSVFPEAASIVWQLEVLEQAPKDGADQQLLDVVSSIQWLGALRETDPYEVAAWPDTASQARAS